MKLQMLYKEDCNGDNCPTVYLTDSGELIVQGYVVDATASLENIPEGETLVRIPPAVLMGAAARYQEGSTD